MREQYADIFAAGGLAAILEDALRVRGAEPGTYKVDGHAEMLRDMAIIFASVTSRSRHWDAHAGTYQRYFCMRFWSHGVLFAMGTTSSIDDLVNAALDWVTTDCSSASLREKFHFIEPERWAAIHEHGDPVEHAWLEIGSDQYLHELIPLAAAAMARPELRQLFPFTSLLSLHFSRCTGYPYTADAPYVWPLFENEGFAGRYKVFAPDGRLIGTGDANTAVELVVRHLPPECGPAIRGIADDVPGYREPWKTRRRTDPNPPPQKPHD
jgi:hypothetical protein